MARIVYVLAMWLVLWPMAVSANTFDVPGGGEFEFTGGGNFAAGRFDHVVRQQFDFSCGSAALATLLTYGYGIEIEEKDALQDMYEHGNKDKIHREGFSMLDMKNYLSSLGLHAEGYKQPLDKLTAVGIPAIVLINRNNYAHFVVVKGVTKDKVLIGDPAQGLKVYSRSEFEPMWNGILFVVLDLKSTARHYFNSRELWAKRDRYIAMALSSRVNDSLGNMTLDITPTPNYYQ